MSQQSIYFNENELQSPSTFSPTKTNTSGLHLLQPTLNSNRGISSHSSIPDVVENNNNSNSNNNNNNNQIDHRYTQFIELIEKRNADPYNYVPSIEDQELIANILYDFHHFKILIRQQRRLEFSIKLFKQINIGYLDRGEFFFHKGDSNKTDLICILSGKTAVFQKKPEGYINQEMDLLGRIVHLNQQIGKIEKSAATISNDMSKSIHQLKQRIEHTEEKLNHLRIKDEDDLLKAYNFQKYFLTENVCGYRRVKYAEHGSTLAEAQVVNGCACESTVVSLSRCFYFSISSSAYREIFGLEITKNIFICNILKQNFPGAKDDSLRRVSYDFREEIYEYNKVIFEENDPANLFIIVRQGEVEARRRIDVQVNVQDQLQSDLLIESNSQQISPLASPGNFNQTSFFGQSTIKNLAQKEQQQQSTGQQLLKKFKGKNAHKEISIGIIGDGQILGIEDTYNNRKTRSFKAISKSNETIIYYINKKQLDDIILLNDDYKLKKAIKNQSKHKSEYYDSRTDNLINFEQANLKSKENHILQENMKKQYYPESKNFKYLIQSWINQKHGTNSEDIHKISQPNSILKSKMSAPSLLPNYNPTQEEPLSATNSNSNNNQNDFNNDKNQSPIKYQRTQLRSLSHIPINLNTADTNPNHFENPQSYENLESPPRKRYRNYKDGSGQQSPQKSPQMKTISMPRLDDFPFKSDLEIINQQIEMKEQCIQYQQQQREKQGLVNSRSIQPSLSPQLSSQQINGISSGNNIHNQPSSLNEQHQSQFEQQKFEETKKRLLFLKNFSNENKKLYRLKSEHSLLNSILKKTSTLKLDFPIKNYRSSMNEIENLSENSDEIQSSNSNSQGIRKKKESINLFSNRTSEVIASPFTVNDLKISDRHSEHISKQSYSSQNNFHLPKQLSHLSHHQGAQFNTNNCIKSLQNLSSVSTYTDLNVQQFNHPHLQPNNTVSNQPTNSKISGISNLKYKKIDTIDSGSINQNYQFNSILESINEKQTQYATFNRGNSIQFPHLKIKNSNHNLTQGFSTQPQSPLLKGHIHLTTFQLSDHAEYNNNNNNNNVQYFNLEHQINESNNIQNIGNLISNEQSEVTTPSTQQQTPSTQQFITSNKQQSFQQEQQNSKQLPLILQKQISNKEIQISTQSSRKDDNIKQSQSNQTNTMNIPVSLIELPFISNRSQINNNNSIQQAQPLTNSKLDIQCGIISHKSPQNYIGGFTDIVQRKGIDSQYIQESQKFKLLKNISQLNQKGGAKSKSKLTLNNNPYQQMYRKTVSAACSPTNKAILNRNNKVSPQLLNFRNESPLMIGKIIYSLK